MAESIDEKRKKEKARLEALTPLEKDPFPDEHGVLLAEKIKYYSNNGNLIQPFSENQLKVSGYKLTAGDEWVMDGRIYSFLNPKDPPEIRIPPFQVVVIKTHETIVMPRFLIGRWNIKVGQAYRGLLWVGGPQVDAGYRGHLFCPIYNLSKNEVVVRRKEEIALIDFVKTTPFNHSNLSKDKTHRYPFPEIFIIEDYKATDLISALYTEVGQRLKNYDQEISKTERHVFTFSQITFGVLAFVVAALAIFFQVGESVKIGATGWAGLILGVGAFSFFVSTYGLVARKYQTARSEWWLVLSGAVFFGLIMLATIFGFHNNIQDVVADKVKSQVNKEKDEIDKRLKDIEKIIKRAN